MFTLKLTQIGNSVGVVLPKEALAQLKIDKGDTLFLTETPGGFKLTPYDPEVEELADPGIVDPALRDRRSNRLSGRVCDG